VRRKRSAENLSVEELRALLIEKQRVARQERLDHYRRTGRVVQVAPDNVRNSGGLESLRVESWPEDEPGLSLAEERRQRRKQVIDRILFVVEGAAIVGLVLVLLNGFNLMRSLNREVTAALQQPTLTPTPLIVAVVLPSGHTPPTSPGGVSFNDAEIPEHLRPVMQSLANLPVPTAGPEQANRLQIAAIHVDAPIVQGDGWDQLKKGVGQHVGSPDPGQTGNIVLSAHNDVFGEIFRNLDQLKTGDKIVLFTNQRQYSYSVTSTQVVSPTSVEVMDATPKPTVTLISCYPYMVDKQRYVVTAELQSNP
jgi:sortase A